MDYFRTIVQDYNSNPFLKGKLIVIFFRLANLIVILRKPYAYFFYPIAVVYIFIVEWVMGVEIHPKTRVGRGLVIYHGVGLVVNGYTIIGDDCILRQGVCIGNIVDRNGHHGGCPVIGNAVEVGAGATILGEIRVGDNVRIGASSVVTKDVPDGATVIGVNQVLTK
jgi:putative colanic acid biosynthesis acetyltransferase WcaB